MPDQLALPLRGLACWCLIACLAAVHASGGAAEPLRVQFLGVSTVQISDGETVLMTDGFFSRPSIWRMLTLLKPDETRIDKALKTAKVDHLAAVLVAHAHHDHAMDAGLVALRTNALVVGTPSVVQIALGSGLQSAQTRAVVGGERLRFGRFEVMVVRSPHSPAPLFPGEISAPLSSPTTLWRYREGGNLSYLLMHERGRVLVHASANFVPGLYAGQQADLVFLGIGTLGKQDDAFIRDYWREVVNATGAKLVIPVHWDDFSRSLDEPLLQTPRPFDDVPRALAMIRQLADADGVEVRVLQSFQTIDVP